MLKSVALAGASMAAILTATPAWTQAPQLAAAAASPASAVTPPPLRYTHRELSNGLKVYAMPDDTAGAVTVTLWYDVGGKDDPEGRSGFAHLFEHILSRKTVNLPYGAISAMVEDVGGTRNASTSQDYTNYYETVPPQYLETMLWTHAERMARPVVDQDVFDAERSIVKEELRQRVYAPPYGRLAFFVTPDNAFDDHIYRRSIIGSIEQLDAATIDDARAFHEAYYRPATATLIVSGAFDPAQLDAWVDQYFGDIANPDRPVPRMQRPAPQPRTAPRQVMAYAPNVPLPAVAALYPGPDAQNGDNAALDVMQAILSRGENSRLYRALVYDSQLASSASFGVNAMEEGGYLSASVTVAQGRDPGEAEAALNAELQRIRSQPVTAAELAEAKMELLSAELRQRETASGRAFILGNALSAGLAPSAPDQRVGAIQAVTAADVQRVAQTYLNERARVSILYQDEGRRPEGTAEDSWRNPAPVPTFLSVPPAVLPPNVLAPEGQRMAAPAVGESRPIAAPVIAERVLPNGLRVIAAKSTDLPIMNAQLLIAGGASADPADRSGLAGMAATLARQGAGDRSAPEIAAALEALGANLNVGASADVTGVSLSAPIASATGAGGILADVVQRPAYAPDELERARAQAVNRLRVNLRQPGPLASAVLDRVVYGAAPYGAPSAGTPESLQALTREEIAQFHRQWWRPDTSTLIITGGMEPEAAFAFAEQALGQWSRPTAPAPSSPPRAGAPTSPRVIVVDMPNAGQAAVAAAVRAPLRSDPAWDALTIANAVIGGGSNGRLFQEVRAKRGLSYGAYSNLSARAESGLLTASSQTKNESAAEVVGLVLAEFDRIGSEATPDEIVSGRRTFVAGGFTRGLETTAGLGGAIAEAVIQGRDLADLTRYAERIQAVTPQAVQTAARASIGSEQAYVVVVGDARLFLEPLRQAHPDLVVAPASAIDLGSATLGLE
ncbi:insulinase family protein [Brevundimonas sp. S30B]|uniref:M16 family metallopeptidase n=1 Tax=unclassified Brevundimonas TaxID=2622653 RepID=UPI001072C87B|nr:MULTISPECIES: pitrilysin family protein [unclassified Brevundimonas]QBX37104.1 insulinase family protein [Brevundimonas sp. MF30-B]TFW04100.1 insulinase family protein [Brevundimonas sp. S30B]